MNNIAKTGIIPQDWKTGEITRIYKGKGKRGKCSNERGITLSSNIGKVFERLLNTRILKQINITQAQGGGRKGQATVDHITKIKETIRINKAHKKNDIHQLPRRHQSLRQGLARRDNGHNGKTWIRPQRMATH